MSSASTWHIKASKPAKRTSNPIRKIVDKLDKKNIGKTPLIQLDLGDPTLYGNFKPPQVAADTISAFLNESKYAGYAPSTGIVPAREAIAKKFDYGYNLTPKDVVITSACSGALEIAIGALADEGDNILIPTPGFSLYQTLCDNKAIETRPYRLIPEKEWEADLEQMRSLIDKNTRAILVNNPSNPCGSAYSKEHLQAIIAIAEEFCLPIIADEIYANMVFQGAQYHAMAALTDKVPILSVGGLAKQYIVPGWRIGWIIMYDKCKYFDAEVRDGIERLTTLIIGACTLIQGAIPALLFETPQSYYDSVINELQQNAAFTVERLASIPTLKAVTPRGAMYCMVAVDIAKYKPESGIVDDITFAEKLLREEGVSVLPGQCFRMHNYVRLVICAPVPTLKIAYDRLDEFCKRHAQ